MNDIVLVQGDGLGDGKGTVRWPNKERNVRCFALFVAEFFAAPDSMQAVLCGRNLGSRDGA